MNAQNAHEYLPLVQALADGKTIQRRIYESDEWEDYDQVTGENYPHCYRIKPEPRTFKMWLYHATGRMYPVVDEIATGETGEWEIITVMEVLK